MQGYVRLTSYGLPSVVAVHTVLTAQPGSLALLSAGQGSISGLSSGKSGSSSSSARAPVIIAPYQTLHIDQLPLTDVVSYAPYLVNASQTLTTWLPIFNLQRSASLVISDLMIYVNPGDQGQARQQAFSVAHTGQNPC